MKKIITAIFSVTFFLIGCATYLDDPFPEPQSDTNKLVFGLNTFGFELYKQLKDTDFKDGNFVISPYSISNCLAMVYAGARNNTEQQMLDVLKYTLTRDVLPSAFRDLNSGLVNKNNLESTQEHELTLKIANSGWFQENYSFLPAYLTALTTGYGAEVRSVDFENNYEESGVLINQWTDNATGGKIPELIPPGAINSLTRLVFVNAIYFNGSWQYPFDESFTKDAPFFLLDGSMKDVPMMSQLGEFQYLENSEYRAVLLPYSYPGSLAMAVIVPAKGLFKKVEREITGGGLYSVIHHMGPRYVSLKIPKFYTRNNRDLADNFKAMGMTDVFSPDTADLSGMDGSAHALFVSFIIHEAVIDVNEKGTEAAAATAVVMDGATPDKPPEFVADRPFIYAIFDQTTDAVLFLGRVLEPELKQ